MYIKRPIQKETNTKRDLYIYEKRNVYIETYIFMTCIYRDEYIYDMYIYTETYTCMNKNPCDPQSISLSALKTMITVQLP